MLVLVLVLVLVLSLFLPLVLVLVRVPSAGTSPSTSPSSSISHHSRVSKGTLLNGTTYVDEHTSKAIRSESTSACNSNHVVNGSIGPYRQALIDVDITQLRRICELRGLRHQGQSRNTIIDTLLADVSFLKKHK